MRAKHLEILVSIATAEWETVTSDELYDHDGLDFVEDGMAGRRLERAYASGERTMVRVWLTDTEVRYSVLWEAPNGDPQMVTVDVSHVEM